MIRILKLVNNPRRILVVFLETTASLWNDKLYIKLHYYANNGECVNIDKPTTFNDKLNWLKLNYHNPLCTKLADKYLAKEYVSSIVGDVYTVKNLGVWKSFDEIDFDSLPQRFVLKATHDSGGVIICKDKALLNKKSLIKQISKIMKKNYFYKLREWVYKDAEPKIIADEFLDDHSSQELTDYKFWCFNGEPKVMYITNKGDNIYENFYDMDYNLLDIDHGFPRRKPEYQKPKHFERMKALAMKLSKGLPFVRIDFFEVNDRVYFGEFTFYDWGGMKSFVNKEWDYKLGSWIKLPNRFV